MATLQNGFVDRLEGDYARIRLESHDGCSNCGACSGSGMTLLARNDAKAGPGDFVRLELRSSGMFAVAFFLFVLPVLALLSGILGGSLLGPLVGLPQGLAMGLGALLLFLPSLLAARSYERRSKDSGGKVMRITSIIDSQGSDQQ